MSCSHEDQNDFNIAQVYNQLADIELYLHNLPKAELYYESAIDAYKQKASSRLRFNCFDCILRLAEVQVHQNKLEQAETNCIEAASIISSLVRPYGTVNRVCSLSELYASVLRKRGKETDAEMIYDKFLNLLKDKSSDLGDSYSELLYSFAQSNIKINKYDKAEEYLKEALLIDGKNTELHLALAETFAMQSKHMEADKSYDKAFSIVIKSDVSELRSRENLEHVVSQVTGYFDSQEDKEKVENYYQIAISKLNLVSFEQSSLNTRIGGVYETYADWLSKQKRFNDALIFYKKCLSVNEQIQNTEKAANNQARVLIKRAGILYLLNFREGASEEITNAIISYRSITDYTLINRSVYEMILLLKTMDYKKGVSMLINFIASYYHENKPKRKEDKEMYATCFGWYMLLLGEYQLAEEPLELALSCSVSDSSIANSKNNLGRLYSVTNKFDKAEELINDALEYYKNTSINKQQDLGGYAESLGYIGLLRLKQKKYAEAILFLEKSLENYERFSTLISHRRDSDSKEVALWLEKAKARV